MATLVQRWQAMRGSALGTQILATGVRLIDIPSRYAFHLIVAAQLGVAAAGGFYIAFSATMLTAGFGRLGIDRALTRAVARAIELGDPGSARAVIARAFRTVLPLAIVVAIAMLLLADPVATRLLGKPDLVQPLRMGAATVVPLTIGIVAGGALAGLHRLGWSLMVYSWLWPALFCAVAPFVDLNIERTLLLIAVATTLNAAVGILLLLRFLPPRAAARSAPEPLLATGLSLFSSEVVQLLLGYAPALVLGIVATDRAVGLYSVAWRLALAINLLVSTVAAIGAPRFAALHARGDHDGLRRAAGSTVAFVGALAILPIGVMLAFPRELLGLLGSGFAEAAPTLRLLLVGQVAAVLSAGSAELLGMTDHAATLRRINLATLVMLIVVLSGLGALWGAEGAALATSLTIIASGAAMSLAIRRLLGFWTLGALLPQR